MRLATVLVAIGLALSTLLVPPIAAADPDVAVSPVVAADDHDGFISSDSAGVPLAAPRDWTADELRAAQPYPLPVVRQGAASRGAAPTRQHGAPGLIPAQAPTNPDEPLINPGAPQPTFQGVEPLGYSYPAPFTRFEVFSKYTVYPYVTTGVLFFTQQGIRYRCSAASIGNYAIWTAGHCVHAGNNSSTGWSTNMVFIPAYRNGNAPKGQWRAVRTWTTPQWYASADFSFDMGGVILKPKNGRKISQVVGALGFAWNQPYEQHWNTLGYPAESPFTGQRMIQCQGSYAYSDDFETGGPPTQVIGCDQTGGTSGGPWILAFSGSRDEANYLNGNNSYRMEGFPLELGSPYFGDLAAELHDELISDTP